jgi:hypothetical protein
MRKPASGMNTRSVAVVAVGATVGVAVAGVADELGGVLFPPQADDQASASVANAREMPTTIRIWREAIGMAGL